MKRLVGICEVWTERLGVEHPDFVHDELVARLSALVTAVTLDVPPAGSAERAVAYGDLWTLVGFLTDAQRALLGSEVVS